MLLNYLADYFYQTWSRCRSGLQVFPRSYQKRENCEQSNMEKRRGRPTIPSNHLMGIRNDWVALLESAWPDIGWQLLSLKGNVSATLDEVQVAMKPLADKNCRISPTAFFEKELLPSTAHEVRQKRISGGRLRDRIRKESEELALLFAKCLEVGRTLEEVGVSEGDDIELETVRRYTLYVHRCRELQLRQNETDEFDRQLKAREAHVCQSELLAYIHSKRGRIHPRKLANALAGLPTMNWRQSQARCRQFPIKLDKHFNYRVLELVLKLTKRLRTSLTDASPALISNTLRRVGSPRRADIRFVADNWRDFRLTLEEACNAQLSEGSLPFVVASRFLNRARSPKSRSERFLSESERLDFRSSTDLGD